MIQDHSDHGASKKPMNLDKDLSVRLMHHDPSDLGSLILIWIISKEHTLKSWANMKYTNANNEHRVPTQRV